MSSSSSECFGNVECIGNEYLAEVCTRGARSVGCCDRVTLTKALLNKTFEAHAKKKRAEADSSHIKSSVTDAAEYIHSFKVGRVGDEELFDVIQFTHSFQLEAQAKKECRSV